jgi:hypothetical protein
MKQFQLLQFHVLRFQDSCSQVNVCDPVHVLSGSGSGSGSHALYQFHFWKSVSVLFSSIRSRFNFISVSVQKMHYISENVFLLAGGMFLDRIA